MKNPRAIFCILCKRNVFTHLVKKHYEIKTGRMLKDTRECARIYSRPYISNYKSLRRRIMWRRTATLLRNGAQFMISATTFWQTNTERTHCDYVGQGTRNEQVRIQWVVGGGRVSQLDPCFSLFGLRIAFIAQAIKLNCGTFTTCSLHKSAYDILCALARKIVRNPSRASFRSVPARSGLAIF